MIGKIIYAQKKCAAMYPSTAPKDPEELVKIHMGLMKVIVHQAHRRFPDYLEFDEKLTCVVMAMMRCMESFDPSKGVKFISYAGNAARYELRKAIKREMHEIVPGMRSDPEKFGYYVERNSFGDGEKEEGLMPMTARCYKAGLYNDQCPEEVIDARKKIKYIQDTLADKYVPIFNLMIDGGYSQREAWRTVKPGTGFTAWCMAYQLQLKNMRAKFEKDI